MSGIVIGGVLNVKADAQLEKAIAQEITTMDDKDLQRSYLDQISVDYEPEKKKKTIVEELGNQEGQNIQKENQKDN